MYTSNYSFVPRFFLHRYEHYCKKIMAWEMQILVFPVWCLPLPSPLLRCCLPPQPPRQRAGARLLLLCLSVLGSGAGFLPNFKNKSLKVEGMPYFCLKPMHTLSPPATSPFTRDAVRLTTSQVAPFFWSKTRCWHLAAHARFVLFLPRQLFPFSLAPPLP